MPNNELMTLFVKEEDKRGTDILAMSDFFSVFINKIELSMDKDTPWAICQNIDGFVGEIATAIKGGFDLSQMRMLVADSSHFSQDIVDGLKTGRYHIGRSKEVAGNFRPAVLDEKERAVKFFTLKKAVDPTRVLSNISTLSIQASLQRIAFQIEDIGRDVTSMIDFARREALSNKFIYARERIMSAANAFGDERDEYLKEADTYLMQGLIDLYSDVSAQVKELEKQKGPFASVKAIDKILSYINEDLLMIPKYAGLRIYLLNYRGKTEDVKRVLGDYRYQLQVLAERKIGSGKYTALELIHRSYPYEKNNLDFWIEKPKQILQAVQSYELLLEQKDQAVYYIDVEA